jgi:transcriptional regulator with XRE-family HTH domain
MNDVLERILQLTEQRNWSKYKLAKESDIPLSSLNSLFAKNNQPTIPTLQKICNGLGITLSDFFDNETPSLPKTFLSHEDKKMLQLYHSLNRRDKKIIQLLLQEMQK